MIQNNIIIIDHRNPTFKVSTSHLRWSTHTHSMFFKQTHKSNQTNAQKPNQNLSKPCTTDPKRLAEELKLSNAWSIDKEDVKIQPYDRLIQKKNFWILSHCWPSHI